MFPSFPNTAVCTVCSAVIERWEKSIAEGRSCSSRQAGPLPFTGLQELIMHAAILATRTGSRLQVGKKWWFTNATLQTSLPGQPASRDQKQSRKCQKTSFANKKTKILAFLPPPQAAMSLLEMNNPPSLMFRCSSAVVLFLTDETSRAILEWLLSRAAAA